MRQDAIGLILSGILMAAGILALAIFRFRQKTTDRGLFWFGLFTGLYGLRLLCSMDIFQFAMEPVPREFWRYFISFVTYAISPIGLFFLRAVFPWATVFRWPIRWFIVFAGVGIATDLALRRPNTLQFLNSAIVIVWVVLLIWDIFRKRPLENVRGVRLGAIAFGAAILVTNVWGLYYHKLPVLILYLEPIAFTGFLASLGAVVFRRLFQNEEQLVAIQKELEVARKIQTAILPRETPRSNLISLATRYLSMTAVAGDFYDFLVVDENRLGVLIADVAGHGVPAALVASMVKVAVSAQLPNAADPALVLAGMNRILCGKTQNQFVTAAYLFVDLKKRQFEYGAAGHPALLCCDARSTVEAVTENGLILGLFPAASYTSTSRPLIKGSRLLLYTDGLVEASDAQGNFFGEEQVRETLRQAQNLATEDCATLLVNRVNQWTGNRQDDDLTLVVIDIHA